MQEDWEDEFCATILERGLDYCIMGKVDIADHSENEIHAIVKGTHDYRVVIELVENEILSMNCTCPYARDSSRCKHMAATLYAASTKTQGKSEHKKLADCPNKNPTSIDIASLKREVSDIEQQYADRYDFIDYYNASDYATELGAFMERCLDPMIHRQKYETAFELVCYIYHSLGKLQIDDSGGEITILSDSCLCYWEEIINKCSLDEQWKFFKWFKGHLYNYVIDYLQCHIDDFFFEHFHEPEMLKQKLSTLDQLIVKITSSTKNEFWLNFNLEKYVLWYLRVMEELKTPPDEINNLCQKYYHLPAIRQFILTKLTEQGEVDQAIQVLKESKQINQKLPGLAAETSRQLMQLYQQTGRDDLYRQELEEYIFNYQQDNLEYIQQLKQLYDEDEWKKKRQKLLDSQALCCIKYEFMMKEKMYDQFFADIRKSLARQHYSDNSISILDHYETFLSSKNPEAVRDLYADFVRGNSEYSNGRQQYKKLIHCLRKIKNYPSGEGIAQQIASEWRTRYSKRRAMMEELERAGF